MSGLTKFLFGEKSYNHNVATFHQTEHAEDLIYEGPLYHHTGLRWKTAPWRLLWQDSKKKEQAVLVRYAERTSSVPVPGAKNVVLLSSIKTLVPIEKHEVEPRYSVTQTKASRAKAAVQRQNASGRGMSAAMAAKNSAPTKYRFALETLAGILPASFVLAHFGSLAMEGDLGTAEWIVLGLGLGACQSARTPQ